MGMSFVDLRWRALLAGAVLCIGLGAARAMDGPGLAQLEGAKESSAGGEAGRAFDGDVHGNTAVAVGDQHPLAMAKSAPPKHHFTVGELSLPGLEKCDGFFSCMGHTVSATATMPVAGPLVGANRSAIFGSEYGTVVGAALGFLGAVVGLAVGLFLTPFTLIVGVAKSFGKLFQGKV